MKFRPIQFLSEVRQESRKVSWPSRKETLTTTMVVLVMVSISAVFFLVVDLAISQGVKLILGLGV